MAVINGTGAAEQIEGTPEEDTLFGDGGDDTLLGLGADDVLIGGNGADLLDGGDGTDTVSYEGTDQAVVAYLFDGLTLGGAAGDQFIGIENLIGGNGDDSLAGDAGNNLLQGGRGSDQFWAGRGDDTIIGGPNSSGNERDIMRGDDGNDLIIGRGELYGGAGDDILNGTGRLEGGEGNDTIIGFGGNGGDGIDTMSFENIFGRDDVGGNTTGTVAYLFLNGHYNETSEFLIDFENLIGSPGNDSLAGDQGDNLIDGGRGRDRFWNGSGDDTIIGGEGDDTLVILAGYEATIFTDFTTGAGSDDKILVRIAAFTTFDQVIAAASESGSDTIINFGNNDILTLQNIRISDLHTDDFQFA